MKKGNKKRESPKGNNLITAPYLVRIGSITKRADVADHLNQVFITNDHLLVLCEVLLDHMWVEHTDGIPLHQRARLLKDLQYDIHLLFEIALASQFICGKE